MGAYSALPGMMGIGSVDTGAKTSLSLDSAFVFETSGDVVFTRFSSPVAQTNGALTVYAFVEAVTGSPTAVRCAVYNGAQDPSDDQDRPEAGGSALATSGDVDASSAAGTWITFSLSSLTLVESQTYYVIIFNATGTPGSNYPDIAHRGYVDAANPSQRGGQGFIAAFTTNGFSADPTSAQPARLAPICIKFNDGTLMGNPYVDNVAHASNQNDRGSRFTFTEDVTVGYVIWNTVDTNIANFEINKASGGDNIVTVTLDRYLRVDTNHARFSPVTLTGGVAYDFVLTAGANDTFGTIAFMGEASPPADVIACRIGGGHVDGTTPGSYALDTTKFFLVTVLIDDNPAIAGGGGSVAGGLSVAF